ncbi:MAG TPA: glycerol-3-phosphate 1-O-acyltransferase PlsY [Dissulfurispiraceae bacterium]
MSSPVFHTLLPIAFCLLAFVLGSVPVGILLAKSKGVDLKKIGSGNIGATNVMRALGKEAALITLLGDMAKGAVAVGAARVISHAGVPLWASFPAASDPKIVFEGLMGISAILGHNFSLFLRCRGGKGVATSLGVLLVFSPQVALFTMTLWLLTAKWTRYSSLSALVASGLLPLSFFMLDNSREKMMIAGAIAALVYLRHLSNIKRLIQGTESRIGEGKERR